MSVESPSQCEPDSGLGRLQRWLASEGMEPWPFQSRTWDAYGAGRSGLVHVPTGSGKTWAAWFGPLAEMLDEYQAAQTCEGIRVLHVSPLRAVGRDVAAALRHPIEGVGSSLEVAIRSGDSTAAERRRLRRALPATLGPDGSEEEGGAAAA